ncbi:DUF6873 family GME fold protein [Paraclostridium bifermentans]|uniref:DUF6873 family GME fold protein n=1 Tax=Paraclostridium bifermentans TaxID=1490 RepID=UPI0021C2942A|nr:hypothetical protein [Paraclostridium bifermentans]GKZ03674.1 hypothetical protein ANS014_21080 [Paraclostridium bifermentans]
MKVVHSRQSFVIDGDLCLALVDKRITCDIELELKEENTNNKTIECKECYDAIKYHPDICVCNLGEGNIVVAPNVYDFYSEILSPLGFNVIKGSRYIEKKYPNNIQYNVTMMGRFAIHNFNYTDEKILDYINKKKSYKDKCKTGIFQMFNLYS